MIQIVSVVNNTSLYKSAILDNPYMNRHNLFAYDNTIDNIGVPSRYNDFIMFQMLDDAWIIFCHQDFFFCEDITNKLQCLDKNVIYGPIGAGPSRQFIFMVAISRFGLERFRIGTALRSKNYGEIKQITPKKSRKIGQRIRKPIIVDTLDCCCMIVHSTLIRKYSLSFDEQLKWHLYAEDFCLNARFKYNILSMALQLNCVHLSGGTMDMTFQENLLYLKKKYNTDFFATTCYDGYKRF